MREISNDTLRHRRASKADQPQIRQQIQAKLVELEKIAKATDRTAQQFLLSQRALWGRPDYSYSTEEKLSMQLEAIRLTHPRFDPEDFQHGHYSKNEAEVIIQIARAHSILGQRKRAIGIYSQLLWSIEKNNRNLSGYANLFCLIAHNYAINLAFEKQYTEAIRISVQGENTCIYYGNYQFLPGFLSIQAECYHFLGDDEKSRELYFSAYYVYKAYRDPSNCENVRREVKTYFGIDMPKSGPPAEPEVE